MQNNFVLNRRSAPLSKRKAGLVLFTISAVAALTVLTVLSTQPGQQNFMFFGENMQDPHHQAFMDFMVRFGRSYSTKEEFINRFQVFKSNYQGILEHNNAHAYVKKEVNHLTDLSEEEFNANYHGLVVKQNHVPKKRLEQALEGLDVPDNINWRSLGKVSTPQNQKNCGSCWAFTTATTLESLYAIKKDVDAPQYSVQYLVDCDPINIGCGGGWMMDGFDFTQKNGIVAQLDYPFQYSAREHACQKTKDKAHFKNTGAQEEDEISNQRLKELVSRQPVGVAMHSNQGCLASYKHGIVMESDCKCSDINRNPVNHAVTIVGYGQTKDYKYPRPDCQEYWVIKNSWGATWGEGGFFNLCMDKIDKTNYGTCQVNLYVQYPLLDE